MKVKKKVGKKMDESKKKTSIPKQSKKVSFINLVDDSDNGKSFELSVSLQDGTKSVDKCKGKNCDERKILNPDTCRCVSKDGATGKKIAKMIKEKLEAKMKKLAEKQKQEKEKTLKKKALVSDKKQKVGVNKTAKKDKVCRPDQILNPDTGRCVKKDGATGKKIIKLMNMFNKEFEQLNKVQQLLDAVGKKPESQSTISATPKKMVHKVIKPKVKKMNKITLKMNSKSPKNKTSKTAKKCRDDQIINPVTGRCVKKDGVTGKKIIGKK